MCPWRDARLPPAPARRRCASTTDAPGTSGRSVLPRRCPSTLAYLGYGVPDGAFYNMDATLEDRPVWPHLASISVVPGQELSPSLAVTTEVIKAKLSAHIGDYKDNVFSWEATKTAPVVFSEPFPSAEMLNDCTRDIVKCPIDKFTISIQKAMVKSDPVPPLEQVWLLTYGLLEEGK